MMPSGVPRAESQGGKRCSSGRIRAFAAEGRLKVAASRILASRHSKPARAKRVGSRTAPTKPSISRRFDGQVKKARILETTKNIGDAFAARRAMDGTRPQ